jgi:hypothetical protein
MKVCDQYSHLNAIELINCKGDLLIEITDILNNCDLRIGSNSPREIKASINKQFNKLGWADRVRVHRRSKLTISYLKDKVGVCFQLGNVARTYADILKLALLGKRKVIDVGIIIVPHQVESDILGANYARFDRLSTEMHDFSEIIELPILILALSN